LNNYVIVFAARLPKFFAFGRAVRFYLGVLFSALRAENRTQKMAKYHAAAGVFLACTRITA
jgi:hypothetical protein